MPVYGPIERLWLRYWDRIDWLRGIGCCSACAMGLALAPIEQSLQQTLLLPCGLPKWRGARCIEMARAAWVGRQAALQPQKEAA